MTKSLVPSTVRYLKEPGGYPSEIMQADRVLTRGALYHVARMEIGDWHTDVWLHEVPDVAFNSVLFERADDE